MQRVLLIANLVGWLAFLPALAHGQIVEVELRDKKAVRAQAPYLLERDGRVLLRGEPRWALPRDAVGRATIPNEPLYELELFVSDLEHPEEVPYTWKNEAREPRWKAREAILPGKDLVAIRVISWDLTLDNLASEVRERRARIPELEKRRSAQPKESDAWFDALYLALENQQRLQVLLERYGFEPASRALDADVARLSKMAAADARWSRGAEALASIRRLETPARLVEVAQAVSEGQDVFTLYESRHLRLISDARMDEARARGLLTLGERVIEGFRREFVDPYDCPDRIPERVFSEFWFGPDDEDGFARYFEEYYGLSWGTPEEKRASVTGTGKYAVRTNPNVMLSYYRYPELDLQQWIAHRLGDQLAGLHFEGWWSEAKACSLAWLEEGLGYHTALEFLGSCTLPCISLGQSSTSAGTVRARRWNERPRDYFGALALGCPKPLDQLVLRTLLDLGADGVAKGWSLVRFFAADGERGEAALHAATRLASAPATFVAEWRAELGRLYALKEGTDALDELERRWRATVPAGE